MCLNSDSGFPNGHVCRYSLPGSSGSGNCRSALSLTRAPKLDYNSQHAARLDLPLPEGSGGSGARRAGGAGRCRARWGWVALSARAQRLALCGTGRKVVVLRAGIAGAGAGGGRGWSAAEVQTLQGHGAGRACRGLAVCAPGRPMPPALRTPLPQPGRILTGRRAAQPQPGEPRRGRRLSERGDVPGRAGGDGSTGRGRGARPPSLSPSPAL